MRMRTIRTSACTGMHAPQQACMQKDSSDFTFSFFDKKIKRYSNRNSKKMTIDSKLLQQNLPEEQAPMIQHDVSSSTIIDSEERIIKANSDSCLEEEDIDTFDDSLIASMQANGVIEQSVRAKDDSSKEQQEEAVNNNSSSSGVAILCAGDDTAVTNTTMTTTPISEDPSLQCAICLSVPTRIETDFSEFRYLSPEENIQTTPTTRSTVCHKEGFAHLPCCGGTDGKTEQTTSTKICTSCLLLLCTITTDNGGSTHIGKCPRCRSWISITSSSSNVDLVTISPTTSRVGTCQVCLQTKLLLITDDTTNNTHGPMCCDACYLGLRHPLWYECQLCSNVQRIPHPMYRYQLHPREFGNVTWACQRNCQTFTKWRILASQLPLIPPGDVPESWGEDVILEMTRARVVQRRNADQHPRAEEGAWSTGCRIS